jgi:hypothetical protein
MSVSNGQRANAATFNNAFLSRLTNSDTVAIVDFLNGDPVSGPAIHNIQRAVNSVCSALGISNNEVKDYLITWAADYVGAPNDSVRARINALVALFHGTTGHTHDGTDGQGPKLSTESISITQANYSTIGNVDDLDSNIGDTIRFVGVGSVTLRGIANGVAGRRRVLMNLTGSELTISNNDSNPPVVNKIITGNGDNLVLQDGAAAFVEYDGASNVWRVISGSGGGNVLLKQETPLGVVDGVNDTFGPFSFTPISSDAVSVYVNGIYRNPSNYSIVGGVNLVFNPGFIPSPGQKIEVTYLYKITGSTIPTSGVSLTPKTEFRTITASEEASKSITLAGTPSTPSEVILFVVGGTVQFFNDDYTVIGNTLSWNGRGLDGLLSAGDKIVIKYYY